MDAICVCAESEGGGVLAPEEGVGTRRGVVARLGLPKLPLVPLGPPFPTTLWETWFLLGPGDERPDPDVLRVGNVRGRERSSPTSIMDEIGDEEG